jgi:U3 small nucleolar RNA-associated protein MPP10
VSAAKSELTPQEKRSQRGKEKKRKKVMHKQLESGIDKYAKTNITRSKGISAPATTKSKRGQEKREKEVALKSIVRTGKGVTVVGKKP